MLVRILGWEVGMLIKVHIIRCIVKCSYFELYMCLECVYLGV
jgi:hypothetical protein